MIQVRHFASAVLPLVLLMTGCGANLARPASAVSAANATAAAKAVAPDDPRIFTEDNRQAQYWAQKFGGSANLVMSIQTTALNTQKISSAANVFFSPEAYYANKPCVFVSRHYLMSALGQTTELPDANKVAAKLKTLPTQESDPAPGQTANISAPGWQIKAAAAWGVAHGAPTKEGAGKRFFSSSRANLVKLKDETNPTWNLYADGQRFVIDAISGEAQPPTTQVNPSDRLNDGQEVDLQRASQVWLPSNPAQPNIVQEPTPSN
ncbi:MAG: hypothetical protein JWM80_1017 [Cyanobacteria bacterium RYN_339]|nr:hypothetical protein [Cyanobacteria bacterium RYN_339]